MQKRLFYIGLVLLVLGGLLQSTVAHGTDFVIDANRCQQVKTRLKQLKLRDAVTRVNYGQVYESISLNIINPTNSRLVNNHLKPAELLVISDRYDKQLTKFRQDYVAYEEALSQVVEISCQQHYDQLMLQLPKIRQLRQQLQTDAQALRQLATDYQRQFKEFYDQQNR